MAGFLPYLFGRAEAPNLPYNPPQIPERFLTQAPVPEMQIINAQRGLIGAKSDWDIADKSMQYWTKQLETPDLTDERKQEINANIEGWGKMRDAAANAASDIRAQADAMGIDVSDYGAGKTLQDANRAYNTYRNTAMRDFLRLPSVRELEESRYTELLNRGVSPRMAKSIIGDERAGRQEDFLKRVTEGVMTYGVNPDGQTLNPFGLSMMQKLDPANPELTARLFAGGFAMPKDMFSEDRADNRTILGNNAAMERLKLSEAEAWRRHQSQQDWNTWNQTEDRKFRGEQTDKTLAAQERNTQLQAAERYNREVLKLQADQVKAYLDSPMGKYESWFTLGKVLFGDERQAAEWAKNQVEKTPSKDNDDKLKAAANLFSNRYQDIESALKAGDSKTALEKIDAMTSLLRDDANYAELLNRDQYVGALHILDIYKKVANREYTLNQAIIEIEEAKHGKMSPDQIMAYLMNNGQFGQDSPEVIRRKVRGAIQNTPPTTPQYQYTPGSSSNNPPPKYQGVWNH